MCTQSMGVVECEEFRELLQFICPHLRAEGAIPHRTKLSELVSSTFRQQYESMVSDIEVCVNDFISAFFTCTDFHAFIFNL